MRHDFNQSDLHISNAVQYFEDDESGFVVTFSCYLGHVVYLDKNVKRSKLPKYLQSHKSHDLIGQNN